MPGTISRITVQVRDPERVSLFIDGEFAFGLPAIEVMKRGLKRGDELTQADIEQLLAVDEIERAVTAALTFVSYRPRSEREVRDRLRLRDFSQPAIDQAVERMRGWNYLDDQAFARWWVENRGEHRPRASDCWQAS
jgi:regulatory protein